MDTTNTRCDSTDQSACYKHTCRVEYAVVSGAVNKCNLTGCIGGESVLEEQACPAGQYLRGFNRAGELDCVSLAGQTCPSGQYMQGFYATGDLNCVAVKTNVVRKCPKGKRLKGITGEGGVICEGICNEGQLWDDTDCKKCYDECPVHQKWNDGTKTPKCQCVDRCPSGQTWNTKCSVCTACVGRQTYNDTTCPGTCTCSFTATTANCSADQRWNDNTKTPKCQCVERCPSGQTWNTKCSVCTACVGRQTYNDTTCPGTCTCSFTATTANCSADQRWNDNTKTPPCQCVGRCSSATPKWDSDTSTCVACPPSTPRYYSSNNTCRASGCPSNRPRWNGISCVACPSSRPKYYSSTNTCRACPSSTPKYKSSNNTCVTCHAFDSTKPRWNSTTKRCQSCGVGMWWYGNSCMDCGDPYGSGSTPHWTGSSCVSCYSLNPSKPKWNRVFGPGSRCEACPDIQVWRDINDSGVYSCECPSSTPNWNSNTSRCVASCSGATPRWNSSTNSCEACPTGSFWSASCRQCVSSCPAYSWSDSCCQCFSGCPYRWAGYPYCGCI